jgi:hypothetical protein
MSKKVRERYDDGDGGRGAVGNGASLGWEYMADGSRVVITRMIHGYAPRLRKIIVEKKLDLRRFRA